MFEQASSARESAAPASWRIFRFPSREIDRFALADGRVVTVRPVLPQDADAEQDFVRSLSAASRHGRFQMGVNTLPPKMLRSMTQVDYETEFALVAEAADPASDDDEPRLIADARYVFVHADESGATAEFAIVVADAWQGVGLARELMRRLMAVARRHGVRRLYGDVLADNAAMLRLMRRLGARVTLHPDEADLLRASFSFKEDVPCRS